MRHSIKSTMFVGALLFGLSMCFTSCEDVLGHWEKPTPVTPTPTPTPEPEPTPTPGLLAGKFTINASGDQVQFSQGNLQATYDGSSWTWAFATNQWDYVGNAVGNTKVTATAPFISENGTVDLFGWVGESSTDLTSDPAKYGISQSNSDNDYGTKKGTEGETLKSDWGTLTISNGGNTPNYGWRTLTSAEWTYLFIDRSGATVKSTANVRCTMATINTDATAVKGMILFPDGKEFADTEATWGTLNNNSDYTTQCTSAQWTALADKGCVFLPAAGRRDGMLVQGDDSNGRYWSSSPDATGAGYAYYVLFRSDELGPAGYSNRYFGHSVRLVRDAE